MRGQVAYMERFFQTCNSYGFGWELHITEELYFIFVFLKRNTPGIKHHVGEDHSNSFPPYCWYFLMFTDKIHKRMEDIVVALHPESI